MQLIKEELPYLPAFRGRISFEVVAWDDPATHIPMLATETPQQSVSRARPRPATCDIVVVILWSRMGTPLPSDVRKTSGEPYASGTEWEYDDACNSTFEPRPTVLVYRRMEDFKLSVKDPRKEEKEEQFEKVEKFFAQFVKPDGSLLGVNRYDTPAEFRDMLRRDLEELVFQRIGLPQTAGDLSKTNPSDTSNRLPASPELAVARIDDFESQQDWIREALELYEDRIPADERTDLEQTVDLVRDHLSGKFGPRWKLHFLVARFAERVVGMLLCYEDIDRDFAFISYLAALKPRRLGESAHFVSERLGRALVAACQRLGMRGPRFLFEVDDPALAEDLRERRRRLGRIRRFGNLAPFQGLHLRVLDVGYLQPKIPWSGAGAEKKLLLCYAAPGLHSTLKKNEVIDILTWTYTELYGDDIFEDPLVRAQYAAHTGGLLNSVIQTLPESVRLLQHGDIEKRAQIGESQHA